jgi:hypothetical protein
MAQSMNISEIKQLYPDEWVLLGNPNIIASLFRPVIL